MKIPRTYEGEGKTTLHIMNKDAEYGLMINGYSEVGCQSSQTKLY